MFGFESTTVPVGGTRWLRERKRETEEGRQKLERGEKWERIEMVLEYIILLYKYIILMCY